MSNNIIGYVKEITGKVTATDPISGSVRVLKLDDPVFEGEIVTGQQHDAWVVIGFTDSEVTITLAGNEELLFDAALRDANFKTAEQEAEDDEMAPSAGEEDIVDESQAQSEFANRTGSETDVNSGLRDASFIQSHGSFAIANSEDSLSSDNAIFSRTDPVSDITVETPQPPTQPSPDPTPLPDTPGKTQVINDLPEAKTDNVDILEDSQINTISGNVFTNDDIGNDVSLLPVTEINGVTIGSSYTVNGAYGELKINVLGEFSYELHNNNLTVQGLTAGENLTETFSYKITDNNGDSATTTLNITINGSNDGVSLTIPNNAAGANDEQVFESGLADGSNPSDADIVNSSFTLTALDGLQTLLVGSKSITAAELTDSATSNITVTTTYGSLVINGYSMAADGTITVSYQYTLLDNVDHSNGDVTDAITIVVNDTDNETTTDTLNIAINDDIASVVLDSNAINEDSSTITDNVFSNDTLGADQTTSPVSGIALGNTGSDVSGNIATALSGNYGSITLNADGNYTYTLDNNNLAVQGITTGESLTETFTYTITDSDGDTATTTLAITIDGTNDGVSLTIPNNAGANNEQVLESGLADGSNPSDTDILNSSFTLKALDGLQTLLVGSTSITAAELTDSANSNITVSTTYGSLVINGYNMAADGTITVNYQYTLLDNVNHSNGDVTDDISITVLDTDGNFSSDSLNIAIIDDVASVVIDTNSIDEDTTSITDNVFTNDTLGADARSPISGIALGNTGSDVDGGIATPLTGNYGSIILNADGSYTYTLDNDNLAVQGITTGEDLTETFTYTITDSDGDTATTTLKITIDGTNDGVSLTIPNNATGLNDEQVFESGLADGSNPSDADIVNSSFTLTALDGLQTLLVGSTSITAAELTDSATSNITVTTTYGSLVINGYSMAADGTITVSYQYTLLDNVDHSNGDVTDAITIVVNDTDNETTTDTLNIAINDDIASVVLDSNAINEDSSTITDNVFSNDTLGADQTTSPISGITLGNTGSDVSGNVATALSGNYGSITLNANGSYTYTLDNNNLAVQGITTGESLTETFTYTITDSDGDTATTTLEITIEGTNDGATLSIPNNAAGANDEQVFESGLADGSNPSDADIVNSSFTLTALDGLQTLLVASTSITAAELADSANSNITVSTTYGSLVINGYNMAADGTITVNYQYTLLDNVNHSNGDVTDDISITVLDTDGNFSSDSLNIAIIDDVASVVIDTNSIDEDTTSITDNVFTNDTLGADTRSPISGIALGNTGSDVDGGIATPLTGNYGSIILNADGSYTYTLDNDNLAVQGITTGEDLTETFTYTITDSDGDSATTTLNITINGTNDGVSLTIPNNAAGVNDEQVFESGLADGSNPSDADIVNSSFTLTALDGLQTLLVGSESITAAALADSANSNIIVTTTYGSLVINGYSMAADGTITVNYQYTLLDNVDHSNGDVTDAITIVVTDTDNETTTDALNIAINDDIASVVLDSNAINEDSSTITDNVFSNDTLGADQTTSPVSGITLGNTGSDVSGNVATALSGNYGSITLNANGSYTYTLDNNNLAVQGITTGESLTETFTYTITDSDGDTATTTLEITIEGTNDGATLSIPNNAAGANDEQVFESGLADGSNPSDADIVNSSFTLTVLDGLQTLLVASTSITAAELADSANSNITVSTTYGSLVINGYNMAADGTITVNYQYTLLDNVNHSNGDVTDDISITVLDTDGNFSSDSLNITIIDDVASVVIDTNSIDEDTTSITDNVFTNDTLGADTRSPISGIALGNTGSDVDGGIATPLTGNYGSIILNADGSYTYTLDNDNLAVQGITTGEDLTETFTYTITDSDGDTATTTLTITIDGVNDGVSLTIPNNATGANDEQVFESGLADGSNPSDADIVNSSFTLTALDGLQTLLVGSKSITAAELTDSATSNITVTTTYGSLVINGYSMAADGAITVSYQYTLLDNVDQSNGDVTDAITIVVTDTDNETTTDTLNIAINDDIASVVLDSNAINEDSSTITDNVFSNDTLGADQTTSPVSGIALGNTGSDVSGNVATALSGNYGSITLNADGSYTYTLDNNNLAVQGITTGESLTETFTYTITDSDGDTATTTLTITIDGTNDGVSLTIPNNATGANDEQVFESGLADGSNPSDADIVNSSFTLTALDGLQTLLVASTSITAAELTDSATSNITVSTTYGSLVINGYNMAADGTITVNYQYTLLDNVNHSNGDVTDDISITALDTDGNFSSDSLNIAIIDDVASIVIDTNSIDEDTTSITDNVFTNDTLGADTRSPISGIALGNTGSDVDGGIATPLTGNYGSIILNADGSYTYTLDNDNLAVQGITTGEDLTETFTYTITDSDGDTATTTLTITIDGVNDGVSLTIPNNATGANDEQVFESGLANGSNPSDADIVNSSFTLTALDDLQTLLVGSTSITAAELTDSATSNITVTTTYGSLVINGYNMAADGTMTVNYQYTLLDNVDHSNGDVTDAINIIVTDTDGETSTDTLNIAIIDDTPIANNDPHRDVFEDGKTITGNVIDNNADNLGDDITGADSALSIKGFTYTNESGVIVTGTVGIEVDTQYGRLTVNADGSWSYTSDRDEDHSSSNSLSESFTYTLIDGDYDENANATSLDTATQIISIFDDTDPSIDPNNNNIVYLYEGDAKVTFDGTADYEKSDASSDKNTTTTATHKLDFNIGSDDAGIVSFTFDGATETIAVDGSATIVSSDKGTLTVHYDGTWEYTPPATYQHDNANGVNHLDTHFSYTVSDTDGDDVIGEQYIRVDDTLPTLDSGANTTVYEASLSVGSNPSSDAETDTGSISAHQSTNGAVDITFSGSQVSLDALINKGLSSANDAISYVLSDSDHTLTASANGNTIFVVTIINPTDINNVSYQVALHKQLDHESALLDANGDIVMDLAINMTDDDGDISSNSVNITIVDDVPPSAINMSVDEDSTSALAANTITTHADATQANTTITTAATYGTGTINADGSLTYVPFAGTDYSGPDSLTYTTTLDDGTTSTTTVSIMVNPIADAPTNLIDNADLTTNEDTAIALGLNAPTQTDTIDLNDDVGDTDNPELYGMITLSGIPNGATLLDGSDVAIHVATGSDITIILSDSSEHLPGLTGSTLTMTTAEYQALKLLPPADSHVDIDFSVSTTSYEVLDSGEKITGVSGATTTTPVHVEVLAVTDPVTLLYTQQGEEGGTDFTDYTATIDEDDSDGFNLSDIITASFGDNSDGSESFEYTIEGVPEGTQLTIDGNSVTADNTGTAKLTFSGTTPTITLTPPADFSGDIKGITITLSALDSDGDSVTTPSTESAAITLDLYVNPIANDVSLNNPDAVTEDTPVAFLANLIITDDNTDNGNDHITEITIGDLDSGFELTTADGTSLYQSTADGSDFTIIIGTTNNPQTSSAFTIAEAKAILLDSHQAHSSADITLDIAVKSIDSQTVNGVTVDSAETTTLFTSANGNALNITVTPVSENDSGDSDGDGNIDVLSQGSHTYTSHADEDTWINLNTLDSGFSLAVSNEDDQNSGIAGASETTIINFSNVPIGSQFTIDGGTTVLTVTNSSTGVDINLADLDTVQFMPPAQYSGTINIHMKVKTTDTDEDSTLTGITETSATDILILEIDPIADNVTLAIKQANGLEDAGRATGNTTNNAGADDIDNAANAITLDITTSSDDTDGSETFVVTISDIPDGGSLYYNGTLMANNSGTNGNLVATDTAGDTWKLEISDFDNDAILTFIPPHNSDDNYTFKVSAYSVDGTDNTSASPQQLDISVDVKGVADVPLNTEVNTVSSNGNTYQVVSDEAILDDNSNQLDLQDIYQTPNTLSSYDNDGSETLTVIVTGLDSQFNITGASFSGGSGSARQWVFLAEDIANIKISTPANFSGEIDFTLGYVSTENEGNSKTHANENISILITPDPEAGINSTASINEDQLTLLNFNIEHKNSDTNESIDSISINKSDLSAGNFTLYYGNSTAVNLDDAVINNINITDTGSHYVFTNGSYNNIYALSDADLHSNNSFEVIYSIKDSATITGGTVDDIKDTTITYELTVNAITDDIDLTLTNLSHTGNASVLDNTVTVTSNTTISVELDIDGINDVNEALNGADTDGSEQVTHLIIENVDNGISVVNALYAGDVYNSNTGSFEHSGTWYLPINESLDSDGVNRTVDFRIISDDANLQTSNIKITAFNEDNNNKSFQNDSQLITIEKDANYSGSIELGSPADITDFSINSIELREDDSFTLDQIIDSTITGSGDYSISFTGLPDGSTVTGATENGNTWYISGNGDSAAILAQMQAVTITLPANFNSFDNADSDTLTIKAKLTTYDKFSQNAAELSHEQPVYPLTDALTIDVSQTGTTDENTPHAFSLDLSNAADGTNNTIIDGNLYIKIEENYKDVGESALGTLTDGNGNSLTIVTDPIGLSGNYYLVSGVNTTDNLDFIFTPGSGRYGDVTVDVYVQNQETHGWVSAHLDGDTAIELSHQNFDFSVKNVIDVVEFPQGGSSGGANESPVNDVSGDEDTVVAGGSNWVALDLSANVIDPSDPLLSTLLDKVPDGFLIYYQDPTNPGSYKLALNTGISNEFGSAYNQWLIPLDNGALQGDIYIQAPEHWSGTIADIKFKTISQGDTSTDLAQSDTLFDVTINAVADNITLNTTKTFGNEGDDIAINLNANIEDLDGSETVTLTLLNLGENANFKANGIDIDDSNISYNSSDGAYTITNIAADDINSLSFTQASFTGTINVSASMVETSNGNSSVSVNASFEAIVSAVNPSTSDDTLFYKAGNDLDALTGNDTLILTNDLGIDFTGLTDDIDNIEQIDLTQNGNHQLDNLSLTDVISMTDSDNDLIILGDSGDSISFANNENWTKGSTTTENGNTYDLYTTSDDPTVVVKVEHHIDDNILP